MSSFVERHVSAEELRDTVIGWENIVNQIVDAYRVRRGMAHGLQKDAIQNAWDARRHKKGAGWEIAFELIKSKGHTFFMIVDKGTTGLTGRILTQDELESQRELAEKERWGRFEGLGFLKSQFGGTLGDADEENLYSWVHQKHAQFYTTACARMEATDLDFDM